MLKVEKQFVVVEEEVVVEVDEEVEEENRSAVEEVDGEDQGEDEVVSQEPTVTPNLHPRISRHLQLRLQKVGLTKFEKRHQPIQDWSLKMEIGSNPRKKRLCLKLPRVTISLLLEDGVMHLQPRRLRKLRNQVGMDGKKKSRNLSQQRNQR